ncbi:cysteine synthase [Campylobacterota bacterium]|nr:cysteine synthase [Campylobacterota bacterium]
MAELLDLIGNTPLLQLKRIAPKGGAPIWAKAEFMNPSGSVKDRAAKAMILAGIERGDLCKGKTILDATSGNTGIAYAMIGAALGYPVKLYLPANASAERKSALRAYGAEIVETDPLEGSDGSYLIAQAEARERPDLYFYPDQYSSEANPQAHYDGTGVEIWEQTQGRVTHFAAITGTSGTFMGTAQRLKEYDKNIWVAAVQPDSPYHGIEGTRHMASSFNPKFYNPSIADSQIAVSTEDAFAMARRLAREEGLFVGISAAANTIAAVQIAAKLPPSALVVTILCDSGMRYASDAFWSKP